jgi:2,4-dienoyl-CoA reductase-like NADH-dependent reductase (Old Yellow Enzyme family)
MERVVAPRISMVNTQTGEIMAIFNQQGQRVRYQYNAAGDINFNNVSNKDEFAQQLQQLKAEIERMKRANIADPKAVQAAEEGIDKAIEETSKPNVNKSVVSGLLEKAGKSLTGIAAVAEFAAGLAAAAKVAMLAL